MSQIFGLWRLDIFTEDAKLKYEIAAPDGIEQYEGELQALHMFIVMMMFMSLTLSSLLSMMRRQGLVDAGGGGGGGGSSSLTSSRRGLSREVIDSLPLKRYKAPSRGTMGEGDDVVEDASSLGGGRNNDRRGGIAAPRLENNNDAECCPICLVDFADGSEVRTLPCGHDFDRECIDSWLLDHITCPTCRENIDNTPPPTREGEGGAPTIAAASGVYLTQQPDSFLPWPFARGADDDGGRGWWRSRWSGVPSADPADASLRSGDDDDETSSNDRLEPTTTTNPRSLGGGWRSRWGWVPWADADLRSDDDDDHRGESTRPRFLGMRSFLGRSGHVGVPVPQNEEEEGSSRRESASVELVLIV